MRKNKRSRCIVGSGFLLFLFCYTAVVNGAETFLEPNQVLDIRASFPVRIQGVSVKEGDTVEKGTLLVSLDTQVLEAREWQLQEVAKFHGMLDSADALVKMHKRRLAIVEKLNKSGNARKQELEKVRTDLAVAKARLLEAKEKQMLSLLELKVARTQIEERRLKSPVKAVVLKVYKQVSEMALATDPEPLLTLVQLDPLLAVFHLSADSVVKLHVGETALLTVAGKKIQAEIEFVSPIIEAQSGTIAVRFRLPNPSGILRSGTRITYAPSTQEEM